MNLRLRLWITTLLLVSLSATASLLLLTLLDQQIDQPAVRHFDLALQTRIHGWTSLWLTSVMLALTWIGAIKIFASSLAVVLIIFLLRQRLHAAAVLGSAMVGAFALNETLKVHFHRARPRVPWSIGDEHTFSFPSGHSLFAVALYGTLAYIALLRPTTSARRIAILLPATLLPFFIGISRIYLGMHYPTDVAAGFIVGALWLAAIIVIDRRWRRNVALERQRLL